MIDPKEKLTDNSKIKYCPQCETCTNWGNNDDPYSNDYQKAYCDQFPHPNGKPPGIINDEEMCPYWSERIEDGRS